MVSKTEREWSGNGTGMGQEWSGKGMDWTDWTDENARMTFGLIYRQRPKEGKNETERVKDWG